MLKVGVLGAGHLGKIHIRLLIEIEAFEVIGFYDPNESLAKQVEEELGIKSYSNIDELISLVLE